MANQRDKTKAPFTFYIDKNVKQHAKVIRVKRGSTLTEYLIICIYNLIDNDENEAIKISKILKSMQQRDTRTRAGKTRIKNSKRETK